jgi:hypothetical protein
MLGDAARWEAGEGLDAIEDDLDDLDDLLVIAVADGLVLLCRLQRHRGKFWLGEKLRENRRKCQLVIILSAIWSSLISRSASSSSINSPPAICCSIFLICAACKN